MNQRAVRHLWAMDDVVPTSRLAHPPVSSHTTIRELGEWAASHLLTKFGAPPLHLSSLLRVASLVTCPPSSQRLFLAVLWMATTHNLARGRKEALGRGDAMARLPAEWQLVLSAVRDGEGLGLLVGDATLQSTVDYRAL